MARTLRTRRDPALAAGRPSGLAWHGRWRLLSALLACLLLAACASPTSRQATATSRPPAGLAQRAYWPTAGWRTAAPATQGMNP